MATETVKKLGGQVTVDADLPGKPVVGVDFTDTQVTDADMRELKNSPVCRR